MLARGAATLDSGTLQRRVCCGRGKDSVPVSKVFLEQRIVKTFGLKMASFCFCFIVSKSFQDALEILKVQRTVKTAIYGFGKERGKYCCL